MKKNSKQALDKLQELIAFQFDNSDLLNQALTHRSAHKNHNERLEFLGDAILGMVIAEKLFEKFPKQPEGKLTRMRASLVNRTTLASIAKELDLGQLLLLGTGELKSGGHRRESILSDAVEAIIGAVYLDAGFDKVKKMVIHLFHERLSHLNPDSQTKDSKTQLQEWLQSRRLALPEYQIVDIKGKDHAQTFTVSCSIKSLEKSATSTGQSRRIAEQKAAQILLEKIRQ